jgi:heme/copper-type cytochrome/quinol oxidase subunit 3
MIHELVVLFVVVANAVVLSLGSIITHLAYRAYRRTRRREMKRFAVGFGFITLGVLFGGGLHQLVGTHVLVGVLAQAAFSAVGFGVLACSLYAQAPNPAGADARPGGVHTGR